MNYTDGELDHKTTLIDKLKELGVTNVEGLTVNELKRRLQIAIYMDEIKGR